MKFSIITVTHNNLSGLSKTAESIAEQTFKDFEWIVVDGGSTDGTVEFLSGFERLKIKWLSEKDNGIFDAMNKGIGMARGDFCIFMNAGDCFFDPLVLMNVNGVIGLDRPAIVYGDSCEVEGSKRWYKAARSPQTNSYVFFTHHQSIFYLRQALASGYDISYKFSADWVLTTRILSDRTTKVLRYQGAVSLFERGGISQSQEHRKAINAEVWRFYVEESPVNRFVAMVYWVAKVGTNTMRRYLPWLYDFVRYPRSPLNQENLDRK